MSEIQTATTYPIEVVLHLLSEPLQYLLLSQPLLSSHLEHLQILQLQVHKHKHKVTQT